MVVNANKLKEEYSQINNDTFKDDIEWLEKCIDFAINKNLDRLFANKLFKNKVIEITSLINTKSIIRFRVYFTECAEVRNIHKNNFYRALKILQKKYKKQGWKVGLFRYYNNTENLICVLLVVGPERISIYIKRSKSFWKSLFSRNRKEYSSVLTEMEKKYL